jgi:hypothetical protein
MAEIAALLVDEVLPEVPVRQCAFSVRYPLRFLFARDPSVMWCASLKHLQHPRSTAPGWLGS